MIKLFPMSKLENVILYVGPYASRLIRRRYEIEYDIEWYIRTYGEC